MKIIELNPPRKVYYIIATDKNGTEIFCHRSQYYGKLIRTYRAEAKKYMSFMGAKIETNIPTDKWNNYVFTKE